MDWGAFAGGLSSGFGQGINNLDKLQAIRFKRQQLADAAAQQAGQKALTNAMFPGGINVPQPDNYSLPSMAQLPVIGPMGEAAGLWKQPPQMQPSTMGAQGQPGMSVAPGTPPTPPGGMGLPTPNPMFHDANIQPSTQPNIPPAVRQEQGQRVEPVPGFTAEMTPQQVAMAIDRANPGLRTSNPQAFYAAVRLGMQQSQALSKSGSEAEYKRAQAGELSARANMEAQHGAYWEHRATAAGVVNKGLIEQYKQNESAIRGLEAQKTRLATAFGIPKPQLDARAQQIEAQLNALYKQKDRLTKQLQGETLAQEETNVNKELSAPIQIKDENLKKLKSLPPERLLKLFEKWKSEGASDEELNSLADRLRG